MLYTIEFLFHLQVKEQRPEEELVKILPPNVHDLCWSMAVSQL